MKAVLEQHGVSALPQAAGQAFYNTSKFTLRDLRASDGQMLFLANKLSKIRQEQHRQPDAGDASIGPPWPSPASPRSVDRSDRCVTERLLGRPDRPEDPRGPVPLPRCAAEFQTRYDETLLHTMYVDKTLSGIQQYRRWPGSTGSLEEARRLRARDFLNDADTIRDAFRCLRRAPSRRVDRERLDPTPDVCAAVLIPRRTNEACGYWDSLRAASLCVLKIESTRRPHPEVNLASTFN